MKAVAQALTFKEIRAIWNALSIILQHKEPFLLADESMETAFDKVDRVMDDMRYQQSKNLYFLIIPVGLEQITEEQ